MFKRLFFPLAFSITFACSLPKILVSDNLKSDTSVLPANGRRGWQINQIITYGDYSTSQIKRGWPSPMEDTYETRFQYATNKLSFTQFTPDSLQAEVRAVGKFLNEEEEFLFGFLSYTIRFENSFTGIIIPGDNPSDVWEFIIHNPEGSLPENEECGMARDTEGNEIHIRGINELEGQSNRQYIDNFGFEFLHNGTAIGAVSVLNNGQVWIKNGLGPDIKLVLSCISTSLLVRHSLMDLF